MIRSASAAVFVSGFLVFALQPLCARALLPGLGGSAQVWNVCSVFFQVALLAGYTYAWGATRFLGGGAQRGVHLALLAVAVIALPLALPGGAPEADSELGWLFGALAVSAGLPFFALAATNTLVQHWYARAGREPYSLYAASNAGALTAVVAYPFLIEPGFGLRAQAAAWSMGYSVLVALIAFTAWSSRRAELETPDSPPEPAPPPVPASDLASPTIESPEESARRAARAAVLAAFRASSVPAPDPADAVPDPGLEFRNSNSRFYFTLLSFLSASLSLSTTTHLTSELPSFPLLWLLPLSLYLLAFTIAFARRPPVPHDLAVRAQPLLVALVAVVMFVPMRLPGYLLHLGAFFVTALVLDGELARRRPAPERLGEFYFWIALGGALGGVFNALVAPRVFPLVLEYPLALAVACCLRPRIAFTRLVRSERVELVGGGAILFASVGLLAFLPRLGDERDVLVRIAILFVLSAAAMLLRFRPMGFGLGIAGVLAGGLVAFQVQGSLVVRRSPYGVTRVVDEGSRRLMFHGTTIHGGEDREGRPLLYHSRSGPMGRLLASPGAAAIRRIGVLGLGAGAAAWYARAGQTFTFFEIDPVVAELAQDAKLFTFLSARRERVRIVLGDARIELTKFPDASFDVLVADAFSSDAPPVHLLTAEAMALYRRALAPHGVLIANTSNRHVDLAELVASHAAAGGLAARAAAHQLPGRRGGLESTWAVVAGTDADLAPWIDESWKPLVPRRNVVWTDDRASLLGVLTW